MLATNFGKRQRFIIYARGRIFLVKVHGFNKSVLLLPANMQQETSSCWQYYSLFCYDAFLRKELEKRGCEGKNCGSGFHLEWARYPGVRSISHRRRYIGGDEACCKLQGMRFSFMVGQVLRATVWFFRKVKLDSGREETYCEYTIRVCSWIDLAYLKLIDVPLLSRAARVIR